MTKEEFKKIWESDISYDEIHKGKLLAVEIKPTLSWDGLDDFISKNKVLGEIQCRKIL